MVPQAYANEAEALLTDLSEDQFTGLPGEEETTQDS
jgi:hypothetical protein